MKKHLVKSAFFLSILCGNAFHTSAQLRFSSLDSLFAFADRNSNTSKIAYQQNLLAKWTKVAAIANTINFRDPVSFSSTNNILLPVNFIPAEAFGGPAGSFRQLTLGQQYVSNFNFNPQIDLINAQNWARVKSAEINKDLTELSNHLNKKSLHESIAAAYYNILSINEQIVANTQSLINADSLVFIVKNKYSVGIARQQDANNAQVNLLVVKDKLQQLQINREQQLNALKILCDIPAEKTLTLENTQTPETTVATGSSLESKYVSLQSEYLRNEWRVNRLSMMPVVSLVYYQGWQQNSNSAFFDNNAKWIQSKYFGLRITVPFPPDANKLSQNYSAKINSGIAALNATHSRLQNELANKGLELDYEKALNSFQIAKEINQLKLMNYEKSLNQYKEGILSTDLLLNAFTDLLNSQLNTASSNASLNYAKARIMINNSFK
ncbi:MAG: TolC family protein [Bacteroidia bacterium]|nr:TolC family protein [Bacteroidia bacterium]